MKLLAQIAVTLLISITCTSFCFAQEPKPKPPKPAKTVGNAKIYHVNDKSSVESVILNRGGNQIIRATFNVSTPEVTKPEKVRLIFLSVSSQGLKYSSNQKMIITSIGFKRQSKWTNTAKVTTAKCNDKNPNECHEVLDAYIPYEAFQWLLDAESITIKFGDSVFELTKEEIEGFRDLELTIQK
jgi:hypothetical protein